MNEVFSRQRLRDEGMFRHEDRDILSATRGIHNRLGLGYQLVFIRLIHRLPQQSPFEIETPLLNFTANQLDVDSLCIHDYASNQKTIYRHQGLLLKHLSVHRFAVENEKGLEEFLFVLSQQLDESAALVQKARSFLREKQILCPADYVLERMIGTQRKRARETIFQRIWDMLDESMRRALETLLKLKGDESYSPLYYLKENPGTPSPDSALALVEKLKAIETTKVLELDLDWLNANRIRAFRHQVNHSSAHRISQLEARHQAAVLVCFLRDTYRNGVDQLIVMFGKILRKVSTKAENELSEKLKKQGKTFRKSLGMLIFMSEALTDKEMTSEQKISTIFEQYPEDELNEFCKEGEPWLSGKYSHSFHAVIRRFTYLRRFTPAFVKAIKLEESSTGKQRAELMKALGVLKEMNQHNTRKVPEETPMDFLPKKQREIICAKGDIDRASWECALLLKINEEIRNGNLYAKHSKRYSNLDDFFMDTPQWESVRDSFFARANLPSDPDKVPDYLRQRLWKAYENYFAQSKTNTFVSVKNGQFEFSRDPAQELSEKGDADLSTLKAWLGKNIPKIHLADLLIEVDNKINFTRYFQPPGSQNKRDPEKIRATLATIMAHGCNLGLTNAADIIDGVSYDQLQRISEWQLTPEAHRHALGDIVKSFTNLDVTLHWGDGKTAASDGQRFHFPHRVLQQTFSTRFLDLALEFYTFIANNYAPFFSLPKECQDRDSSHLLDGVTYNESDLEIEELYTDHHGYTDINFAAFAFLGKRFCPRIRGLKNTKLYYIDTEMDYRELTPIVKKPRHRIPIQHISNHWDRAAQLFASIEYGHATASTVMKRLVALSPSNHIARTCLQLGWVLKTEHVLRHFTDPVFRAHAGQTRLKVEELHALYRDIYYGQRGHISARKPHIQANACSCLTLIAACIIYWQADQISHLLKIHAKDLEALGINPASIAHISPISWEKVIIYGQYYLHAKRIR